MTRDPLQVIAEAQARANADNRRAYHWVFATAFLSHVRWYLTHGVAAGGSSLVPDDDSISDRLAEADAEVVPWIN